jgi:hypothetical protein
MTDEKPLVETVREGDIYRQYAMSLLAVNVFFYDTNSAGMKFSMNEAQKQLSIQGGIANNYLLKRVGDDEDDASKTARTEVNSLITRQEKFITSTIDKTVEFEATKTESMNIIKEYDRLLLRHGVCK